MDVISLKAILSEVSDLPQDDLLDFIIEWIGGNEDDDRDEKQYKALVTDLFARVKPNCCSLDRIRHHLENSQDILQASGKLEQFQSYSPDDASLSTHTKRLVVFYSDLRRLTCSQYPLDSESRQLMSYFTAIPECLYQDGVSLCVYDNIGMILTGGLMNSCAVFQSKTLTWQTFKQNWVGLRYHASACVNVSTISFVFLNSITWCHWCSHLQPPPLPRQIGFISLSPT